MAKLRGMDAVIAKSEKSGSAPRKKAALKRKGAPGVAIVIAMGKPKGAGPRRMRGDEAPKQGAAAKLAALEARIAELEAQLAAMEDDEDEDEDEMDDEEMA